jgi:hypothetical protein
VDIGAYEYQHEDQLITATAGEHGSVNPAGEVNVEYGADQAFTITPDENYHVADVLVDGDSVGTVTTYEFIDVTANHTLEVLFTIDTHEVTFDLGEHGTHTGGGEINQSVDHGSVATEPLFDVEAGWVFSGWSTDFSNITGDLNVVAEYHPEGDSDSDGMQDDFEQQIIDADPNDDITTIDDVLPDDDFDGDGHTNREEYEGGTDPTDPESFPRVLFTSSELVLYNRETSTWSVYWIDTEREMNFVWGSSEGRPMLADYDGDGYLDAATYEGKTGQWDILYSSGGSESMTWGWKGGVAVPADYDGDGMDELGFYDPDTGGWFIYNLDTKTSYSCTYGWDGCLATHGDYDGDDEADLVVYDTLNSHWYIYQSSSSSVVSHDLGATGAIPVPGDYNGDGLPDPTVFYPPSGTWYIHSSLGGDSSLVWGWNKGCYPLSGDFDNDGTDDLAVFDYRLGRWNIYYMGTGQSLQRDWSGQGGIPAASPRFGRHD